ncbi:origin recognition complex subunit 4-like isoform X1 [Patiria miniata]|uniref:Origin recognition complex subunit 4 n=3 Tax=Patiria miniata TaxID=46514 RepID=A0A914BT55_PATMI|nr:origin recognition complex subunit 4-like isoform X1 [Patiria miniata]XP_038079374.1 origin recognition complex subunit 4-like isoform X1 [Patiria miniata]
MSHLQEAFRKTFPAIMPKRNCRREPLGGSTIDRVQSILRRRVCRIEVPPKDIIEENLKEQRQHLVDLINRCAVRGESNSAIVTGPHGSGKTMLVSSVLREIESNPKVSKNLLIIRLNGLLQTDDKIAIQEITRQLQLDNVVGDKVFGSFAENLAFLLEALKRGSDTAQSVLFILEEFDLFAHHKNQTLLYNLFDICQSAQTPIAVIGVTRRLDVVELLEKRVKSRFSHRHIHVFNSLAFPAYKEVCKRVLTLPAEVGDAKFVKRWNQDIEALCSNATVHDVLKKTYQLDKSICRLQSLLLLPICKVTEDHPAIEAVDLVESSKHLGADSKAAMLHGISVLQLALVIAMKHLTDLYEGDPFNFEMLYNEYLKFVQRKAHVVQSFEKPVVLKAFEHLVSLEIVKPVDGHGSRTQKEYRAMSLLVTSAQLMDVLNTYPGCPSELKHWASNPLPS